MREFSNHGLMVMFAAAHIYVEPLGAGPTQGMGMMSGLALGGCRKRGGLLTPSAPAPLFSVDETSGKWEPTDFRLSARRQESVLIAGARHGVRNRPKNWRRRSRN